MKLIQIGRDTVAEVEKYKTYLETFYVNHGQEIGTAANMAHLSLSTTLEMILTIYDNARDMQYPMIEMGNDRPPNTAIQLVRQAMTSCKTFLYNLPPDLKVKNDEAVTGLYHLLERTSKTFGLMLDNNVHANRPYSLDEHGHILYDIGCGLGVIALCSILGSMIALAFERYTSEWSSTMVFVVLVLFAMFMIWLSTMMNGGRK